MKLLVSLLLIALSIQLISSSTHRRVGKTGYSVKNHKKYFPDGPTYANLNVEGMAPSEIEENTKAYRRLTPFDNMNPNIYHKDPEAYYGKVEKEGTVESPGRAAGVKQWELQNENGMLLVHDPSALAGSGYDKMAGVLKVRRNPAQNTHDPNYYYTEVGAINHKDPAPYYDPIQNPDNMWSKKQPNIFSTPVQYKDELFPSNAAALEYRRRLIAKPGMYYDPSHRLESDDDDALANLIQDDKDRRTEKPSIQLDEYNKQADAAANQWNGHLNHKPEPYNGGTAYIKWVKKLTDKWAYGRVQDIPTIVKANDPDAYYDGSYGSTPVTRRRLRRRFIRR